MSLDVQYIDGTKIEVASNRYTFVWRESVEESKAKLETKIDSVQKNIESVIEDEHRQPEQESLPVGVDSERLGKRVRNLSPEHASHQIGNRIRTAKIKQQIKPLFASGNCLRWKSNWD